MIKQLRLGNIVQDINRCGNVHLPNNIPLYVYSIRNTTIQLCREKDIPTLIPKPFDSPVFDVCGLPLTKDWLLNFGFKSSPGSDIYCEWTKDDFTIIESYKKFYFKELVKINFEYVHQLQNFYFDMKGLEVDSIYILHS